MRRRRTHEPETLTGFRPEADDLIDSLVNDEPAITCKCGKAVFADRRCAVCKESVLDAIRRTAKGAANGQ